DSTLKREGDKVILRIGKESVAIPEDLLQEMAKGHSNVSGLMTPSRCFVATHEDSGYSYRLACINRQTGKMLWKSEVFATWWEHSTGIGHMWVTVTEQNKRIVLFGCASTGMHVEAFRPEDGTNLFRFSTSY